MGMKRYSIIRNKMFIDVHEIREKNFQIPFKMITTDHEQEKSIK